MNKVIMILVITISIVMGYGVYEVYKTAKKISSQIEESRVKQDLYYEEMLKKI